MLDRKIINGLFLMICISLIFNNIPKPIAMPFIGGSTGNKLVFYPLIIGVIYTAYCQYKYKNILVDFDKFIKYISVYLAVMIVSVVVGLYNYPYYDLVLNGPINQIEKLPKVIDLLHSFGVFIDTKLLLGTWVIVRQIKGVIFEAFWCFGGAYMIYCWYKDDWRKGVDILIKGVFISCTILIVYSIIEVFYLGGSLWAVDVLKTINPYIHTIKTNHGWWPPLLWKNQLRMVFVEPSNVGNYMALALPVLWCYFCKNTSKILMLAITVISFLIFLTKARTAYAMLFGMLVLFALLIIYGKCWQLIKKYAVICCCIAIGFGSSLIFFNVANSNNKDYFISAESVIENNFTSLASSNKRSNGARYALLASNMRIFTEHPMFGVGRGLASAYIVDNFTEEEAKNGEVSRWIYYQKERGPMSTGYSLDGALNEYITRLAQSGVVGLLIFLWPFVYLVVKLLQKYKIENEENKLLVLIILFAVLSSLVAGCNLGLNMFYCIWVLLGLGYAMCFSTKENKFNE